MGRIEAYGKVTIGKSEYYPRDTREILITGFHFTGYDERCNESATLAALLWAQDKIREGIAEETYRLKQYGELFGVSGERQRAECPVTRPVMDKEK